MAIRKVGICGGTFDPIHRGHLACADFVRQQLSLDAVLFLPVGEPPHKLDRLVTPAPLRLEMVRRAVADEPFFQVSDLEIRRNGPTYTVDTLKQLHELVDRKHAEDTVIFYYIVGADALGNLLKWRCYEEVFSLCEFVALLRPGYDELFRDDLRLVEAAGAVVHVLEGPCLPISSTEVRRAASAGESLTDLVPDGVATFIVSEGLYRELAPLDSLPEWQADLQKRLSEKRYLHCLRVMEESVRLADLFGADREKCQVAGLLHDCARELSREQFVWLGVPDIPAGHDLFDGFHPNLTHGRAGRILAQQRYGIQDPVILDAIGNHVTGRPEMDLVSAVVFLADYTEPGRVGESFDRIRAALAEGLYPAIVAACESTMAWILQKGMVLGVETLRTRNWALLQSANA